MKYGVRKPNIKKSIKARTTGKVKRQVKRRSIPFMVKGNGNRQRPEKGSIQRSV